MGSAHEDQGCCQIVVMYLDEFLVVHSSHLAVSLVKLSSMALLISEQPALFFPSRKSKRPSFRTRKNSLFHLLLVAFSQIFFLLPLFFGALAEIKGQIQKYRPTIRRMKRTRSGQDPVVHLGSDEFLT